MRSALRMVEVTGLTKTFGGNDGKSVAALEGVDLNVEKGNLVSVIGPSGCGKSTLLYLIAGLIMPSSGVIRVGGAPVVKPNPRIGIVFQEFRIFPWKTVLQNVRFGLELKRVGTSQERDENARRYIRMVGLDGFEHRLPKELSGGHETAGRDRTDLCLRTRCRADGRAARIGRCVDARDAAG